MKRFSRRWGMAAFAAIVLTTASTQAQNALPEEKTGPKVGEEAPSFNLKGHDGKQYSLDDLLKNGKVALVFFRSARW